MKAFKVTILFTEKEGFTEEGLLKAIQAEVNEIKLKLFAFDYKKDAEEISLDFIPVTKKFSKCVCIIEHKEFGALPYHQIVLGGIQTIDKKYPYIDIHSIDPEFVDVTL